MNLVDIAGKCYIMGVPPNTKRDTFSKAAGESRLFYFAKIYYSKPEILKPGSGNTGFVFKKIQ